MNEAIIELAKVSAAYNGELALQEVSLTVQRGEFLAIVGPNGSGKTTLLKVVLGLLRPLAGRVRVFGRPPWQLGTERWRIGYVPQVHQADLRFPVNAYQTVLMGRYGQLGLFHRPGPRDRAAAEQALERVALSELAQHPIGKLSGGQRQRVYLARALVAQPELLLLDEPTTGVDPGASESFYELLSSLHAEGLTIVLISHDVGVVAQQVDQVACLNRRLIVHGRPQEVLSSEALAQMYGCEAVLFLHGRVPHIVVERPEENRS